MNKKYNVVTLGSRDYYQVSISLVEANKLGYLITDFYSKWPTSFFTKLRRCDEIRGSQTISLYPFFVLAKLLSLSTRFNGVRKILVDYIFGFIAGAITLFKHDRAVVYSYYIEGFVAFYKLLGKRPKDLICFQVHPTPWYINKVIDQDLQLAQNAGFSLFEKDVEASYSPRQIKRYIAAIEFCDSVICASSFTERSLRDGTDLNIRVGIVPYGSKLAGNSLPDYKKSEKIRLVTVCQLTQRKGMHWAFEAMRLNNSIDCFDWIIVANKVDKEIAKMAPTNVRFMSRLTNIELKNLFANSDLFLMPSLVEGFGLVYIEALSQGLPIVYTDNTGPNDFCLDSIHGFKVECSSLESLMKLFRRLEAAQDELAGMRKSCHELAIKIDWPNFRERLRVFIQQAPDNNADSIPVKIA